MAEGLLRDLLHRRGIDAEVASAGLLPGGAPATPDAVAVLADRGLDLTAHRSRTMTRDELEAADLVLAMERRHLQEAIATVPFVRDRALTLVDAVRRAEPAAARRPAESLADWAERLTAGRGPSDILGVGDDGIVDPIGQSHKRYEATAEQLADLVARLVARAWPLAEAEEGAA
jgi:protein-tyrosine-phosphatase